MKYLPAIIIISIIWFCVGRMSVKPEIQVGADLKCPTLTQQLKSKCVCPEPEVIMNVGCVDNIKHSGKVRVDAPIIEKYNTLTKKYEELKTLTELSK